MIDTFPTPYPGAELPPAATGWKYQAHVVTPAANGEFGEPGVYVYAYPVGPDGEEAPDGRVHDVEGGEFADPDADPAAALASLGWRRAGDDVVEIGTGFEIWPLERIEP